MSAANPADAQTAPKPSAATKENPFANSLGMKFVPVAGTDALFSIWDTRVQEYEQFVRDQNWEWEKPSFEQGPTHPAVNVSHVDAIKFSSWLTAREIARGLLKPGDYYRLPKDWEWSVAVGLNEPRRGTPEKKNGKIKDVYPWGKQWPPPKSAGNYYSYHLARRVDFRNTSPVGSFAANQFGLFDMGGNVRQWCQDKYNGGGFSRVVRGSMWWCTYSDGLLSSCRINLTRGCRSDDLGFRCVLVMGGLR